MSAPRYTVTAREPGGWNKDTASTKKDRNPSWVVSFVRFKTPGVMFRGDEDPFQERPMLVVENDCVNVDVSNPKSSFAKTAQLTMKIGEIYYANAVAPGDWVFIWMSDQQDDMEQILDRLMNNQNGTNRRLEKSDNNIQLNNWYSGLKFVGRVHSVPAAHTISAGGQQMLAQTINCQAFLELASSVYYTFVAQNVITLDQAAKGAAGATEFYTKEIAKIGKDNAVAPNTSQPQKSVSNGLEAALTNLSHAFDNFYRRTDGKDEITGDSSPEAVIGLLFIITMGIDADKSEVNNAIPGARGTFSDAIGIPQSVSNVLGRRGTKLWQMYNLYLGMQHYDNTAKTAWEKFSPKFTTETSKKGSVFYRTPTRCKGFVPFLIPPIWDNNSFWAIYSQFLNPVVNEMYTALRINRDGRILPSLIIREKPFSTKLFDHLLKIAPLFTPEKTKKVVDSPGVSGVRSSLTKDDDEQVSGYGKEFKKLQKSSPEITERTMFNNLPRWVIDESVIVGVNTSSSESNRVNFVQVWGRSRGIEFSGANINQEVLKQAQFLVPNYVSDSADIKRHGLRADVSETNFDVVSTNLGTISHILCRQRADWLFNGQLKLAGTISLQGVTEPICEGDNVQVRGILYHIEAVQHSGSLDGRGQKTFRTTLTVSNGIVASSLDSKDGIPVYAAGDEVRATTETLATQNNLPGFSDVQNTGTRKGRNEDGEST